MSKPVQTRRDTEGSFYLCKKICYWLIDVTKWKTDRTDGTNIKLVRNLNQTKLSLRAKRSKLQSLGRTPFWNLAVCFASLAMTRSVWFNFRKSLLDGFLLACLKNPPNRLVRNYVKRACHCERSEANCQISEGHSAKTLQIASLRSQWQLGLV